MLSIEPVYDWWRVAYHNGEPNGGMLLALDKEEQAHEAAALIRRMDMAGDEYGEIWMAVDVLLGTMCGSRMSGQ